MALSVTTHATPSGLAGKIFATFFFSIFLAAGLAFETVAIRQTARNLATYSWTRTEATILSSAVQPPRSDEADPTFHIRYTYIAGGAPRESSRYDRDAEAPETSDAYQLAESFSTGKTTPCWYNPSDLDEVVLHRTSPWSAVIVLFPLIFVAIGGGGIWAIWFWKKKAVNDLVATPISSPKKFDTAGRLILGAFFTAFLIAGLAFLYGIFIRPVIQIVAAQSWSEVPCEIVSSRVKTHDDSDGDTYSVDIVYRYVYQNHQYTANRYHFSTGSSSGYKGKAGIVRRYPPGSRQTCYIDPSSPGSAVLNRGFTSTLWFGLIPLVFVLVGAGGLYAALTGKIGTASNRQPGDGRSITSTARRGSAGWTPGAFPDAGPKTLEPSASPKLKLIGLLIAALFWNGIVSIFLFNQSWKGADLIMGLFLIPFVAIGLGLIGGVFYQAMALRNPRPRIVMNSGLVRPGDTLALSWEFSGQTSRIEQLTLRIEGREEATYRRGTDNVTDKETFLRITLLDTTDPASIAAGRAAFPVPPGAMHTFHSANNKIVWALHLHGKIPRWPDVKEEYALEISPGVPAA